MISLVAHLEYVLSRYNNILTKLIEYEPSSAALPFLLLQYTIHLSVLLSTDFLHDVRYTLSFFLGW